MRMSDVQKAAEAAEALLALSGKGTLVPTIGPSQGLSLGPSQTFQYRDPHHETHAFLSRRSVHVPPFPYWTWGMPLSNCIIPFREVVLLNIYWYCVSRGWYPPYCGWSTDYPLPNGYPRPASKKMVFHISMYLYFCKNGWEPPFVEWVCGMPLPKGYPPPFRSLLPTQPQSMSIRPVTTQKSPSLLKKRKENPPRSIRPVPTQKSGKNTSLLGKRKENPLKISPSSQKKKAKKVKKVSGRWTPAEHREFLSCINRKTKKIKVKDRTPSQIRSHIQKCNKRPEKWYPMKAYFFVENVEENQWFSGYYDPNTKMYVFEDESVPRDELVEAHRVTWTY